MDRYLKYLKFAPMIYNVDVKLGLATDTSFIDGKVKYSKSFDHIDQALLLSTCNLLIGDRLQKKQNKITFKEEHELIIDEPDFKPVIFQDENIFRKVQCHSIEVVNFNLPNFSLEINCTGLFSIRSLIEEIGEKMNSACTITKMLSLQQGPFTIQHCIRKTDLYWKYIKKAIDQNTPCFVNYVYPYLDRLPFYEQKRCR